MVAVNSVVQCYVQYLSCTITRVTGRVLLVAECVLPPDPRESFTRLGVYTGYQSIVGLTQTSNHSHLHLKAVLQSLISLTFVSLNCGRNFGAPAGNLCRFR